MARLKIGCAVMKEVIVVLAGFVVTGLLAVPAEANDGATAHPNGNNVAVDGNKTIPGDESGGGSESGGSETSTSYDDGPCGPGWLLEEKYRRRTGGGGPWMLGGATCVAPGWSVGPVVTPDLVLEAVETVGLPVSTFEVPAKTLVNFETTVYTRAPVFARTVRVVGYEVEVRAEPSRFDWHFGDGEARTTTGPGAPYPSEAITHAWADAHRIFRPRVDTIYAVSYRVDDGPWLDIAEPLTAQGPQSRVRIKEATPILS
jgi:hypothetical protein